MDQQEKNAKKIWDFFRSKGFSEPGVAGILGNMQAESGIDPKKLEYASRPRRNGYNDDTYTSAVDTGTYSKSSFTNDAAGYGLVQWTYSGYKKELYEYAKSKNQSIGNLDMQVKFLYAQLKNDFNTLFTTLYSATDIQSASTAFLKYFERPADQSLSVQKKRASFGAYWYKKFTGKDEPYTDDDPDVEIDTVALKDIVDLETMYQYVITVDRNTKRKIDLVSIQKSLNVVGVLVEAGYLFDKNHKRVKLFENPKIRAQIGSINKGALTTPWGLFMVSRAQSQVEAVEEIQQLYYVINQWTPELGVWIVIDWGKTSKSINDKMLNAMYDKLNAYGMYGKIGIYGSKTQVEKYITWNKHCTKWWFWWNFHTQVKEYKDEVVTPEFFKLSDGKNNPQPVTVYSVTGGDGGGLDPQSNPDTSWKAKPAGNGSTVNYYNKYSNILILGDSRCVQMYNNKINASFTAVWGGHYGYGGWVKLGFTRIDSTDNMKKAKSIIKAIQGTGKVPQIFLISTINDFEGGSSGYQTPVSNMINAADSLRHYIKSTKGTGTIYCCSLIGYKNGSSVSSFNNYLKSKANEYKWFKYLNINPGNLKYDSDRVHYTESDTKKIFKIIYNAAN